jgi:hypothetical protein
MVSLPVWLVDPDTKELVAPNQLHPKLQPIKIAQAFTISLKSCKIFEDLDQGRRGDNDLLILTRQSLGDKQEIQQVHFWEPEIPEGTLIKDLLSDTIFATEDYSGEALRIVFQVVEVDTDQRDDTIASIKNVISRVGGAFPLVASYAGFANLALGLFDKIYDLFNHDEMPIRNIPFKLFSFETADAVSGDAIFQAPATYVVFAKEVEGEGYQLDSGILNPPSPDTKVDYITFNVTLGMSAKPKYIIGKKMETLLSQLRFADRSQGDTVDFLQETLEGFKKFQDMERLLHLSNKPNRSPEEETRMGKLAEDLKAFIPSLKS